MGTLGRKFVARAGIALLVTLAVGLFAPIAQAADVVGGDRADNSFDFTYRTGKGITQASSSIILKRHDPVQFTVGVAEEEKSSAIYGRVVLDLARQSARRYEGTITFTVNDFDTGSVAYTADQAIAVTLRPKRGQRSEKLKFPFAVPDGHYSVTATFSN